MGPSGSGKSTLLHCLAGILVPDSGEVSFDGQRLDTMREEQRSRAAPGSFRLRLPVRPARPGAHRGGERRAAAPARRHPPRGGLAQRAGLVRTARTRWLGTSPRWRDVRRTGPARRAGPRSRRPSGRAVRGRANRLARLAHRRARDGLVDCARRARRGRRWSSSPTNPASPPTPTARSSCATDEWPPPRRCSDDPPRPAPDARKRTRSRAARPRHRGSRRPRRRPAAGCPGRSQRAARPDRPWCVARHLGAGVPTDLDIRPAVVAVGHRPVRQPGDRPGRRGRRRAERSGPAGDCAPTGTG